MYEVIVDIQFHTHLPNNGLQFDETFSCSLERIFYRIIHVTSLDLILDL